MANFEDPLNLIVCGVGGQGNVVASRMIGRALVRSGYHVTIGETYGAAQRGGAVMSHIRVSKKRPYGPFIPRGKVHLILSLEPMETLRMLGEYGSPQVATITNFYPLFPVGVIMGQAEYPDYEELKETIDELSKTAWFVNATRTSVDMGVPVVANVIMIGALIGTSLTPLTEEMFEEELRETFPGKRLDINLKALQIGMDAVK